MPGCCCLNNTGCKLLFRINWWFVNQGFNVAPREEVHWCEVCWQWRPSHWLIPSNPKIVVSGSEMSWTWRAKWAAAHKRYEKELTCAPQTRQSLLRHCPLCIKVGGCTFEHLLYIGMKYNFFSEYFNGFTSFPTLVRPNFTVHTAARMHLLQIVPWQYIFVLVLLSPHEVWAWSFSTSCMYISIQYTYTFIQYIYNF